MGRSSSHHKKDNEKVWLGGLGAFLFSLIGAGVYFLLNAVGLIEAIGGFIAVYCAIIGYSILSKRESKRGVIISLVIAAAVIILSWFFCFCFNAVEEINKQASALPEELRYTISIADFIPKSFAVIAKQPSILISLGLALVFGALGYFSYANGLFYAKKPKKSKHRSHRHHDHE